MPIQEKELKGVLKSLKQINAALGTVTNNDLLEDIQAMDTILDTVKTFLGADGTSSIAQLATLLEAQLE